MIKVITIVGARPQFIKAAAVSRVLAKFDYSHVRELIVHTGQHYDDDMSQVFFDEMGIPSPEYRLGISGGAHGSMTGKMLEAIEEVLVAEKPDKVLVYGDTNSTLAGALAAVKLHIPLAHVEAGLRSFNMRMPEEINRIVTDRISTHLFCPTRTAVDNLGAEGITDGVLEVGDVMFDVALHYGESINKNNVFLERLNLEPAQYVLATCHRAENTDDVKRLSGILSGIQSISENVKVVFSIHPRTKKSIEEHNLGEYLRNLLVVGPLPFHNMASLERNAKFILTDSGGIQKEAFFLPGSLYYDER